MNMCLRWRNLFFSALSAVFFLVSQPPGLSAENTTEMDFTDIRAVIQQAKDKVFPAVVFIKCVRETMEYGRTDSHEVVGSGVLISEQGEVLTNWHVVDKAKDVRCMLYDGRVFNARVVGGDKDTDLALLQLNLLPDSGPLPYAELGDSDEVSEGDFVMAMGAPWGLSRSVSMGIISCSNRKIFSRLPGPSQTSFISELI